MVEEVPRLRREAAELCTQEQFQVQHSPKRLASKISSSIPSEPGESPHLSSECIRKARLARPERLVDKAEEVAEKDLQIHQKDKLYNELKALLARQPGPEVAGQLRVYQQSLGERERQMSQMKSELSHFHTQAAEYKHEMGRLGKELRDVKMKYFEQKKKDLAERERIRAERAPAAETLALEARSTLTRFTGGGFNLSAPWSAPSHSGIQSSQGALS